METSIPFISDIFLASLFLVAAWEALAFLPAGHRERGRYVYLTIFLLLYVFALAYSFIKV